MFSPASWFPEIIQPHAVHLGDGDLRDGIEDDSSEPLNQEHKFSRTLQAFPNGLTSLGVHRPFAGQYVEHARLLVFGGPLASGKNIRLRTRL